MTRLLEVGEVEVELRPGQAIDLMQLLPAGEFEVELDDGIELEFEP